MRIHVFCLNKKFSSDDHVRVKRGKDGKGFLSLTLIKIISVLKFSLIVVWS